MKRKRTVGRQFRDSAVEFRRLRTYVFAALIIALGIVLGQFSIQLSDNVKIGISFVANQLGATMFGPVVGGIMGGIGDIVKYIIKPTGPFSPLWTLNAIVGPMIYGIILYKRKLTFMRVLISKAIVAVVVNTGMHCAWMSLLYGKAFFATIPIKLIQEAIQVPLQSVLFFVVAKALFAALLRAGLGIFGREPREP